MAHNEPVILAVERLLELLRAALDSNTVTLEDALVRSGNRKPTVVCVAWSPERDLSVETTGNGLRAARFRDSWVIPGFCASLAGATSGAVSTARTQAAEALTVVRGVLRDNPTLDVPGTKTVLTNQQWVASPIPNKGTEVAVYWEIRGETLL